MVNIDVDDNWDSIFMRMNMEPTFFTWWDGEEDDTIIIETFFYDVDEMIWREKEKRGVDELMKCFKTEIKDVDVQDVCPICLDDMDVNNAVESPCNHIFCRLCIEEWLKKSELCPVCKYCFNYIID
jgi:hypothetical protein